MNKSTASLSLPLAGIALIVGFCAPWAMGVSGLDMFSHVKTSSGMEVYFFLAALAAVPLAGLLFVGSVTARGLWPAAAGSALLGYSALYGLLLAVRAAWAISSWGVILVVVAGVFAVGASIRAATSR